MPHLSHHSLFIVLQIFSKKYKERSSSLCISLQYLLMSLLCYGLEDGGTVNQHLAGAKRYFTFSNRPDRLWTLPPPSVSYLMCVGGHFCGVKWARRLGDQEIFLFSKSSTPAVIQHARYIPDPSYIQCTGHGTR